MREWNFKNFYVRYIRNVTKFQIEKKLQYFEYKFLFTKSIFFIFVFVPFFENGTRCILKIMIHFNICSFSNIHLAMVFVAILNGCFTKREKYEISPPPAEVEKPSTIIFSNISRRKMGPISCWFFLIIYCIIFCTVFNHIYPYLGRAKVIHVVLNRERRNMVNRRNVHTTQHVIGIMTQTILIAQLLTARRLSDMLG